MFKLLLENVKTIGVAIAAFIAVYILKRNKDLSIDNNALTQNNSQKEKIIDIQQKVIDVTENTKSSDFDGNIKRMQDGKL